jgi:hypothetical protein
MTPQDSTGIQVGHTVTVLEGALPKRIVGRTGVVVDVHYFDDPHYLFEADVKFSDRFGDKYSIDTRKLKLHP